jgi:LPS-assembly protein
MVALTRTEGEDTRRLSLGGGWVLPYIGPAGDTYTLSATLRGDLYHVNGLERANYDTSYNGFAGRLYPEAKLEWRYPFVRDRGTIYQVVEPIVAAVLSPYGGNSSKIPNEDSQEVEFDDTNLFSSNRFSGYDRVEGGPRINYGVKWGVFGAGGGSTTLIVGQSARWKDDDTFGAGSGLEDRVSDIVGALHVAPNEYLDIHYRTQLQRTNLEPRRNEVRLSAGPPLLSLNANYVFYERSEGSEFDGREELTTNLSSQFTRFWRGTLSSVRDLDETGGQRLLKADLTYEDECLEFGAELSRSYFEDRELKPNDAVMFRLLFKTLGEVKSGVTQIN